MTPVIRPETPADREAIRRVHEQAFGRVNEADLVDAVRRSPGFIPGLSLVVEQVGRIVGHVMFSTAEVWDGERAVEVLALAPLAVLPSHQRQGIGSGLTREGIERARALGGRSVVVLGHPAYYPRFGFRPAAEFGILPPWGKPTPALMALALAPGGLDEVRGIVSYPAAFDGV